MHSNGRGPGDSSAAIHSGSPKWVGRIRYSDNFFVFLFFGVQQSYNSFSTRSGPAGGGGRKLLNELKTKIRSTKTLERFLEAGLEPELPEERGVWIISDKFFTFQIYS